MKEFKSLSDEQLALLYIDGNCAAFDELLNRVKDKLYNYIMCIVKDTTLADDFFQETFIKIIDKLHGGQYVNQGTFQGWIMRMAHNLIMDYYRKEKTTRSVDSHDNSTDITIYRNSLESNDLTREEQYAYSQSLKDAKKIMEMLPEVQREVAFMRFYQNLSFKEIAEITDVSINTALGRMRYAMLNMKKMARKLNLTSPY